MKIRYMSDLHMELSGHFDVPGGSYDEVLVLAGDLFSQQVTGAEGAIVNQSAAPLLQHFLEMCSLRFHSVIVVLGNHDFWGTTIMTAGEETARIPNYGKQALDIFNHAARRASNVYILQPDKSVLIDVDGDRVNFIGSTVWTDVNGNNPVDMFNIESMLNDFKYIVASDSKTASRRLRATDWVRMNTIDRDALEGLLKVARWQPPVKTVIVMHTLPFALSVDPKYRGDALNYAFFNTWFDRLFNAGHMDHVSLIIHGHTHHPVDYHLDHLRVVCNPRGYVGYGMEESATNGFDVMKTVEI